MKKTILAVLAAGMLAIPSIVSAATPYVSASAGLGFISNHEEQLLFSTTSNETSYDAGPAFNGAFGLQAGIFRLEAALGYQTNSADESTNNTSRATMLTYMANACLDIPIESESVKPYLLLGLGGATITLERTNGDKDDDSAMSVQVGAGVGIKASEQVTVDVGYRYFTAFDLFTNDITSHQVLIGARYAF